jgi:GNAT superfamily N-acetyltransferase
MNIIINQAQLNNYSELTVLTNELGYSATENETEEWLGYLLRSENHKVFIAVNENKQLCGWVVVEKRISLEAGFKAEITGLVVSENFRRFGVGRKLVSAAEDWTVENGLSKLVVRSNIKREESHVFYKNIGFTLKKSSHNYEKNM